MNLQLIISEPKIVINKFWFRSEFKTHFHRSSLLSGSREGKEIVKKQMTTKPTPQECYFLYGWRYKKTRDLICLAWKPSRIILLSSNHDREPSDKYFISYGLHLKSKLSLNTNHEPCNIITSRKRCVMEVNFVWLPTIVITLLAF